MPIELLMPALSPTMTEGNLARWLKKEGDHISAGEVIAEIETDKATMEVEAIDEGTLGKIVVAEGAEGVPVNTVIGLILEDGEDSSALEGFKAEAPAKAEALRRPRRRRSHRRRSLPRSRPQRRRSKRLPSRQRAPATGPIPAASSRARSPSGWRARRASTSRRSRAAGRVAGSSRRTSSGR